MARKIIQNEVECLKCGDRIYSGHRHDYRACHCGAIAVDGGMDYLRRVGDVHGGYVDHAMEMDSDDLKKVVDAVAWSRDNKRNDLGTALAVIRALRDTGYLDMEKFR